MQAALVNRFDVSEIGKPVRTPQGFLKIPAYLTRAGIFEYRRADGSVQRELRPAEEVFKADSLATLAAAPLTNLHPSEMVSPKNVRAIAVGHVSEHVKQDGDKVSAHVTVQDADMIAMVDNGQRREISCGYQCRLDATPGVWNGQRYDAVQRDIVYNHAALGPRNWGRAGSEVALRLDAGDAVTFDFEAPTARRNDNADPAGGLTTMNLVTIRIDNVDVQVQKEMLSFVESALKSRADTIAELTKSRDTLQAKVDANTTEIADLKKQLGEAKDPKRIDSLVTERAALLASAVRVLGAEQKFDGLTSRQVHELVIKKLDDKFDPAGKSDDYVLSRFDAEIAKLPAGGSGPRKDGGGGNGLGDARGALLGGGGNGGGQRQDGGGQQPAYVPPWQRPLSTTRS